VLKNTKEKKEAHETGRRKGQGGGKKKIGKKRTLEKRISKWKRWDLTLPLNEGRDGIRLAKKGNKLGRLKGCTKSEKKKRTGQKKKKRI